MLGLVEADKVKLPYFERARRALDPHRAVQIEDIKIGEIPAVRLKMSFDEHIMRRSAARIYIAAMEKLERSGAKNLLFRSDFPRREVFSEDGFFEADDGDIWEAKCADIAVKASRGGDRALLISEKPDERDMEKLRSLGEKFRYVALMASPSMGKYCRSICKHYGISVIERPSESSLSRCSAAIVSGGEMPVKLGERCVTVSGGNMPRKITGAAGYVSEITASTPDIVRGHIPEGYDAGVIIAEGIRRGAVNAAAVEIGNVKITYDRK